MPINALNAQNKNHVAFQGDLKKALPVVESAVRQFVCFDEKAYVKHNNDLNFPERYKNAMSLFKVFDSYAEVTRDWVAKSRAGNKTVRTRYITAKNPVGSEKATIAASCLDFDKNA